MSQTFAGNRVEISGGAHVDRLAGEIVGRGVSKTKVDVEPRRVDFEQHGHCMNPQSNLIASRRAVVIALLASGALPLGTVRAAAGPTGEALIAATLSGDRARVEALLAAGAPVDAVDRSGNTALIFAARDGRLDIAVLLIGHGAQIDRQDDEKVTALIIAAFRGHDSIVDLLLDQGAAVDIRDRWRRTALDYALRRGDNDAIALKLRAAGARTGAAVE